MTASSKTDPLLAKAEPTSNTGSTNNHYRGRKEQEYVRETTPRSVRKEGEEGLQASEQRFSRSLWLRPWFNTVEQKKGDLGFRGDEKCERFSLVPTAAKFDVPYNPCMNCKGLPTGPGAALGNTILPLGEIHRQDGPAMSVSTVDARNLAKSLCVCQGATDSQGQNQEQGGKTSRTTSCKAEITNFVYLLYIEPVNVDSHAWYKPKQSSTVVYNKKRIGLMTCEIGMDRPG
ncbi:hypothetical protein WISP_29481 [Willisornis vidua]|uniref:Uncharacterized protein n=1 Tax=Willisornis vidua TaxID=1566151 RepID=A0ABQ9DR87_9PASS|nr:hypothetical protein WISP_29481 [Willisornis vidua]